MRLVGDREGIQNGCNLHRTSLTVPTLSIERARTHRGRHTRTRNGLDRDLAGIHLRCTTATATGRSLRVSIGGGLKGIVDDHSRTAISLSSASRSKLQNITDCCHRKAGYFRAWVVKLNRRLQTESRECFRRNGLSTACGSHRPSTSHRGYHTNPCFSATVCDLAKQGCLSRSSGLGRTRQVKGTCRSTPTHTPSHLVG